MPQIANITVKKADGTTDITYVADVPSAGDRSPASWTVKNAVARALRINLSFLSQWNGQRSGRRCTVVAKYPVIRDINGVQTVVATIPVELTTLIPQLVLDAEATEAVAQFGNLIKSPLISDSLIAGYAPT